jgi:hypothetical protein
MATDGNLPVSVGTAVGGSTYYPWPDQWTYPLWQPSTTYVYGAVQPPQDYANEVEVDRGEYDATLRFYRRRGTGRTLIKELSVPLAVLEGLVS